jgi:cupin 2 domain-containing protein
MIADNLFTNVPDQLPDEQIMTLLQAPNVRIERIVSTGHATAPDQWYDQDEAEWVVVLAGSAGLIFEGETEPRRLEPGSYVHIGAHVRHRVAWTDPSTPTVWLAIHFNPDVPEGFQYVARNLRRRCIASRRDRSWGHGLDVRIFDEDGSLLNDVTFVCYPEHADYDSFQKKSTRELIAAAAERLSSGVHEKTLCDARQYGLQINFSFTRPDADAES